MIISQPDRLLLHRQMAKYGPVLKGKVLDIGSGRFNRYQALCTNAEKFTTLDPDSTWKPDIVGSAENMPIESNSFDGILCTQVLEHIAHPEKAVREMYRVLKPGGILLLTAPQMNELHEIPHDYFRYTNFGLETLMKDVGFEIEVMHQRGKYHATVAQQRIRLMIDKHDPYKNKFWMLILAPLSKIITSWALFRDNISKNEAVSRHAIGWLTVVKKV